MKIVYLMVLLTLSFAVPSAAIAQASFALRNYDSTAGVDAPVYDWSGAPLSGTDWRVELYGGVQSSSLAPLWNISSQRREIVPLVWPGYFTSSAGTLSVFAAPSGGWAWLQVKVWDVKLGVTYEEAVARDLGGYGQSALFYAKGGYTDLTIPTLPGPLIGLQSFSVSAVVPEPSTGALLLLGGLGLCWAAHRRKASTE